jgi:hypothetical protein
MSSPIPQKKLLDRRAVGQRYGGKHPRTIKRWVDAGVIPPPDLNIRDRDYWYEDALDRHDRELVAERAAAANTPRP